MAPATRVAASKSSHHLPTHDAFPHRKLLPSASSVSLAFPHSASVHSLLARGSRVRSSGTWTTSSGELGLVSDTDEVEDRAIFVHEYNRLAKKHGVKLLIIDDFGAEQQGDSFRSPGKRGWLLRVLRATPNMNRAASQVPNQPSPLPPRHKRSVSDFANILQSRREHPKAVDIQDMVRLSGKSMLYLPQEYAPCSLVLPTCIRATAQYLAQNVTTRGLFRIPRSVRTVADLFDHYCYMGHGGDDIAGMVRCANLPQHIPHSVHDVASTFKRLLSVLPGGILGSLALFDALVAIHSQLNGEPEFPWTKQTKVRARLIALAIGTIKSQFWRELICAVFGLLSLIGRAAEVTPREDEGGRPLPTGDLMGYSALGIVFGPLLVGDLLDLYTMRLATPTTGMLLFPLSPQRLRRDRRRPRADSSQPGPPTVNKIMVANSIAEMLVANWRDVVRQMKSLGAHHSKDASSLNLRHSSLRQSALEPLTMRMPADIDAARRKPKGDRGDGDGSPESDTPTMGLSRRRSKPLMNAASRGLLPKMSMATLSPTREESVADGESTRGRPVSRQDAEQPAVGSRGQPPRPNVTATAPHEDRDARASDPGQLPAGRGAAPQWGSDGGREQRQPAKETAEQPRQVFLDSVSPRLSSRPSQPSPRSRHERGSSETTQTVLSLALGEDQAQPSPVGTKAPGTRVSNNASSYDGSEDSPAATVPFCEHVAHWGGTLGSVEARSRSPRPMQATLPHRQSKASIAGVSKPDSQADKHAAAASQETPRNSVDDARHPPRRGTEHALGEVIPRGLIDRTPDHFYRPAPASERRYRGGSSGDGPDSSQSGGRPWMPGMPRGDSFPRGLDLMRYRLGQRRGSSSASERNPLGRQPRASKSQGQLGSQVRVMVQSPTRSSSSERLSKRGSVKAMAAMFESHEPAQGKPPLPGKRKSVDGGAWVLASSPCKKCGRQPQPGQAWMRYSDDKSPEASSREGSSETSKGPEADERGGSSTPPMAEAGTQTDEPRQDEQAREDEGATPAPPGATKSLAAPRPEAGMSTGPGGPKPVPSLGTMVPCREPPPIAQHLSRPRPLPTLSPAQPGVPDGPAVVDAAAPASAPPPRGTTVLYSQVQSLQRHLGAKTEEATQLRRQLEAQENSEVGTLSEQLRAAKRDLSMWKDRAESAEKRVQVFERFTTRLRGIRDALFTERPQRRGGGGGSDAPLSEDDWGSGRSSRARRSSEGGRSSGSGKTQDARTRRSLRGNSAAAQDGTPDGPGGLLATGADGSWSSGAADVMDGAEQIWAVAEELLRMKDDGVV